MDSHSEIRIEHRNQQQKFTYYLIALCVTSIGFAVYKTNGERLK